MMLAGKVNVLAAVCKKSTTISPVQIYTPLEGAGGSVDDGKTDM
jgi:hypothetical protein